MNIYKVTLHENDSFPVFVQAHSITGALSAVQRQFIITPKDSISIEYLGSVIDGR